MKKYTIFKNIFLSFILINTFFLSVLNIDSTVAAEDYSPVVTDIPDQFIAAGDVFNLIYLDGLIMVM